MQRERLTLLTAVALILTVLVPAVAVGGGDADPMTELRGLVEEDRSPVQAEAENLPADPEALLEMVPERTGDAPAVQGHAVGVGIREADDTACLDGAYLVVYTASLGGYVDPMDVRVTGIPNPADPGSRTCNDQVPYVIGQINGTVSDGASRVACAEPATVAGEQVGGWADDLDGDSCRSGFSNLTAAGYVAHVETKDTFCSGWGSCTYYWYEYVLATIPDDPEGEAGVLEISG